MSILKDKIMPIRRYLILEESNVLETLRVIGTQNSIFIRMNLIVNNCGWADEPTKWFIHFDASNDQWRCIVDELVNKGFDMMIKDSTHNIYLIKR